MQKNKIMEKAKEQAEDLMFLYSSLIRNSMGNDEYNKLDKSIVKSLVKSCAINACVLAKNERERAVSIAYQFMDMNLLKFESMKKAGSEVAFVNENVAEECRYVGNAISGTNALAIALNQKEYWDRVIEEIKK